MESLIFGKDSEVMSQMISFYAPFGKIIDATCNKRKMWKNVSGEIKSRICFCDIDKKHKPDYVCSWDNLPFGNDSISCVVFDPPHLPSAAATKKSLKQYKEDYGLKLSCGGDNILPLFAPAMEEFYRILKFDGIVIAKIKDYVHNHKYQWMLMGLNEVAKSCNFTPCDLIIKRDPCGGNLKSGKWKNSYHARNVHCYFPVYRKGGCEKRKERRQSVE